MTLTLSQIHAELLRIYAHDLTPTNVLAVERMPNGDVRFETDNTELERQLAHASADLAKAQRALQSAQDRSDTLQDYIHDLERAPTGTPIGNNATRTKQ